jgi:serine/threonine-protein kinase
MIRLIPKFIALIIVFFIISGISTYFTVRYFIKSEEIVIVPDLVGEDIIYVLELLTHLGLNTKVKESEYSRDFAQNNIIFQDPKPGEVIKKGRDVRIIISKGTKTLSMPNLKGLNFQQAQLIIDKNGLFKGNNAKTFHDTIKKNIIISQYPIPGKKIVRGGSSNLLVSLGKRPLEFLMPDLGGLFLDEAVLEAEKNHLVIDSIKTVYQENKTANIILNQDPLSGYHVQEDHQINLEVNRNTDRGPQNTRRGEQKNALFRYQLASGYLKQHIRIELRAFNTTFILYDELMTPEKKIWVLVPGYVVSVIFLYKNDELVLSRIFD